MSVETADAGILEIDLGAIQRNWLRLGTRLSRGAYCAGVVKADAYGLGLKPVATALADAGCRLFFVAQLAEGIALRAILPDVEIAVLNGILPGSAGTFAAERLTPVLNDLGQIAAWRKAAATAPPRAVLHVDTGMSRLGLPPDEVARLAADPGLLRGIEITAIMSHLACADEPSHPLNARQLSRFQAALSVLPTAPASLAASSGIFLGDDYHFAIARPGAAVYGINPQPGSPNPMSQAIRLKGKILQTRSIDRGESVGYGATYCSDRKADIATVAVGYADGWLRSLSNRGSVAIAGYRVPVVGRISMDLLTVDVSGIPPHLIHPGAEVELIGPDHGVDAVAEAAGTIGYEILTSLGRRYARLYTGGAA